MKSLRVSEHASEEAADMSAARGGRGVAEAASRHHRVPARRHGRARRRRSSRGMWKGRKSPLCPRMSRAPGKSSKTPPTMTRIACPAVSAAQLYSGPTSSGRSRVISQSPAGAGAGCRWSTTSPSPPPESWTTPCSRPPSGRWASTTSCRPRLPFREELPGRQLPAQRAPDGHPPREDRPPQRGAHSAAVARGGGRPPRALPPPVNRRGQRSGPEERDPVRCGTQMMLTP